MASPWVAREQTHTALQRQLPYVGVGGPAVVAGSNVWNRLRALPLSAPLEPRILPALTTLFANLDARVAGVVEEGVEREAYLLRVRARQNETDSGRMVAPAGERLIPLAEAHHTAVVELVRDWLLSVMAEGG